MCNILNGKIVEVNNMNGLQSSLMILGNNNHLYLLTATPTGKFYISDEGEWIVNSQNELLENNRFFEESTNENTTCNPPPLEL